MNIFGRRRVGGPFQEGGGYSEEAHERKEQRLKKMKKNLKMMAIALIVLGKSITKLTI